MPAGRYRQVVELAVLKALGDETRYAMYRELATLDGPLSAQELADSLGLHANTVRLHLERLRETGLVDAEAMHRGTVGRPQHLYFLAPGAPVARIRPARPRTARRAPRARSPSRWAPEPPKRPRSAGSGVRRADPPDPVRELHHGARRAELDRLGFEPAVGPRRRHRRGRGRIEFLHCPFRELAEAYPELVCNLHRGICEGVVGSVGGGSIQEFATLYDPEPCHVTVASGYR